MKLNYCEPSNCKRRDKCNRYLIKFNSVFKNMEKIGEDLSDICKGERLFLMGDKCRNFPSKKYYIELLDFFDNICPGVNCGFHKEYKEYNKDGPFADSQVPCKKGASYTCKHKEHPDNKMVIECFAFLEAENKAFKKAGKETGKVKFVCPICNGEAWAERYNTPDNIAHKVTIRSYCKKCGFYGMN